MSHTTQIRSDVTGDAQVIDIAAPVSTPEAASARISLVLVEAFAPLGDAGLEAVKHLAAAASGPDADRWSDVWLRLFLRQSTGR